ncbi:AbrB/MazE/SpoVT family DNA-binding domain-containing protein [Bathymodiolus thermophilus thioautotrophic gill symbiont]|uniref:AbrB family transcriptional regulator n=1 Tax=Bathymodiolus thermophilus thioautotrophic gill symbiont TaxID=2360 RepID=A0A1J5U7S6_9GAMM|nr:AbrB/MazE/SpoVT family DNA-binding domain-containing protein [Bathymodiolus thermophilus thioautotrophic gill symbiont]OIR24894.1 AbrB family transcriptional regulator [Bathymodiolus thermophilus thioautotrophic gill symbiont]
MSLATISSKGQVTIPKSIRDFLHLNSGDKIEVLPTKNGEAIIRPISKTVDEMFCKLKRSEQQPLSVEEMNEALGQRFKDRWR